MNTMHDKNAEVPKNALKNIDPNMGLSQMACQSSLDNRQKDLQEVFFLLTVITLQRTDLNWKITSRQNTPALWPEKR